MMKLSSYRIFIIILLIMTIQIEYNSINPQFNVNNAYGKTNTNFIHFNSSQFVVDIIDKLQQNAIYQDDQLWGWPYRLNGPFENDERMYRGYNVGIAGVGDFLLQAYQAGYLSAKPLLQDVVDHFESNALVSLGGGKYWGRFSNEDTAGWIGLRYGNAGIMQFLSELDKTNFSNNHSDLVKQGFTYLKSMQEEDGAWPMTEDGYLTTGQEYGATGVGMAMLKLYQNLKNQTYLDEAIDVGNYLLNQGTWIDDQFVISWTPQEIGSEFDGLLLFGKSAGIAGITDFLLDLYAETDILDFYNAAIGLGKSIIAADLGGYWPDGSVSYVSKVYTSNDGLTGYGVGTIGIAQSVISLFEKSNFEQFLISGTRAEKFVQSLLNDDFSLPVGILYKSNKLTGKNLGVAGFALYLLELYDMYGIERHLDQSKRILIHLYDLINENGLLPYDESESRFGYSFNLENGLAGVGKILLMYENVTKGTQTTEYEKYYQAANPNLIYNKNSNESENSEAKIDTFVSFFVINYVIILIFYRKKRTFDKNCTE